MAFNVAALAVPYVSEAAVFAGEYAAEATGFEIAGTAAKSAVITTAGKSLEFALRGGVDSAFGTGTFDQLEQTSLDQASNAANFGSFILQGYSEKQIVETLKTQKIAKEELNKQTANFANSLATSVTTRRERDPTSGNSTIANSLLELAKVSPLYAFLSKQILDNLSDFVVPVNDPDYIAVSSVYNGAGLFEQTSKFENDAFTLIDETGSVQGWKLEWNNHFVVPPIWGTYTGINSPNNTFPSPSGTFVIDGQDKFMESYLDKCAMFHDIGYHVLGSFNKFSDLQLVSRLEAGKRNGWYIFENEAASADIAISYFSTLGYAVRKIYGDKISDGIIKDLYNKVYDEQLTTEEVTVLKDDAVVSGEIASSSDVITEISQLVSLIDNLDVFV